MDIRDETTDPAYLDAFLQGARFALFALEGRFAENPEGLDPELAETIDELHDMFGDTREGLSRREPSLALTRRFIGKN